jgi:DNA-directed RNA polymerase beta subunit
MLSYEKSKNSKPIAVTKKGKIIYLDESNYAQVDRKDDENLYDIPQDEFKNLIKNKLTHEEMKKLERFITKREVPEEKLLNDLYHDISKEIEKKQSREINLNSFDDSIEILPAKESQRIYYAGPSGSGKSYNMSQYMKNFKNIFPKKKIFLFSDQDKDEQLDKFKPIRIMLNEDLIDDPIKPEELKDSLCIFDDIDSITNKKLKNQVELLRDTILKRGRHSNIYCLVSNHQINEYRLTKEILSASSIICFYPKSGSSYSIKYLLKQYIGLNREQINKIMNLPSRYVYLSKTAPMYVVHQNGVYLL